MTLLTRGRGLRPKNKNHVQKLSFHSDSSERERKKWIEKLIANFMLAGLGHIQLNNSNSIKLKKLWSKCCIKKRRGTFKRKSIF
jgi:hypothetical protein